MLWTNVYTWITDDVGGEILLPPHERVILTTPAFPDLYPNRASYTWVITPMTGYGIWAIVDYLSLEATFDTLTVGTGNDSTVGETQLQTYTGYLASEDLHLPWNPHSSLSFWFKFETDFTVRDKGFIIIIMSGTWTRLNWAQYLQIKKLCYFRTEPWNAF